MARFEQIDSSLSLDSMDRGAWPFSVGGVICLVHIPFLCVKRREKSRRREEREKRRAERQDENEGEEKEKMKWKMKEKIKRLNGPSGNILTLCIQYRDPNWNNCWFKDTNRFHSSESKSTKTGTNGAKVVLMLLHCSKVDWSAAEIWRKPLERERTLQPVTSKG